MTRRAPSGFPLCAWDDRCPALGTHRGLCGRHDYARRCHDLTNQTCPRGCRPKTGRPAGVTLNVDTGVATCLLCDETWVYRHDRSSTGQLALFGGAT